MKRFKILSLLCISIFIFGNMANAQKKVPKTDNTEPKSVLVPSSNEILLALKKAGKIKWGSLVTYNKTSNYKGRKKQALNLGVRVADAFVAIFDHDDSNFGYMNNTIFSISESLGISGTIKPYHEKIKKLKAKNDWLDITLELDEMNITLQREMEVKGNSDIVLLSSIGGFFEGINIVSRYFSTNYNAKKVGILKQVHLVDHFVKQLDKKAKLKKDPTVKKVYNGLIALQKIYKGDKKLSQKSVKKINAKTKEIINLITKS